MAPWCIYISCFERAARSGSGRDSVRGSVGAMNAKLSRPDGLATVQSGRKQAQSRVCTPGLSSIRINLQMVCAIYKAASLASTPVPVANRTLAYRALESEQYARVRFVSTRGKNPPAAIDSCPVKLKLCVRLRIVLTDGWRSSHG